MRVFFNFVTILPSGWFHQAASHFSLGGPCTVRNYPLNTTCHVWWQEKVKSCLTVLGAAISHCCIVIIAADTDLGGEHIAEVVIWWGVLWSISCVLSCWTFNIFFHEYCPSGLCKVLRTYLGRRVCENAVRRRVGCWFIFSVSLF